VISGWRSTENRRTCGRASSTVKRVSRKLWTLRSAHHSDHERRLHMEVCESVVKGPDEIRRELPDVEGSPLEESLPAQERIVVQLDEGIFGWFPIERAAGDYERGEHEVIREVGCAKSPDDIALSIQIALK